METQDEKTISFFPYWKEVLSIYKNIQFGEMSFLVSIGWRSFIEL